MKGSRAFAVVVAAIFLLTFTLSDVYAQAGKSGNGGGQRLRDGSCLTGTGTAPSTTSPGMGQHRGYGKRGARGGAGVSSNGAYQSITGQGVGQNGGAGRGGNGAGLRLRDGSCLTGTGTPRSSTVQGAGQNRVPGPGSSGGQREGAGVNPNSQK